MNFYFEAAKTLDRLDAKEGSIKGLIATLPEKDRRRTGALVIETLKCEDVIIVLNIAAEMRFGADKAVLKDIITTSGFLKQERKIKSPNLAFVLVHDLLLAPGGIQASDGPIKQAVLRHKTRLHGELQKLKIKRGAKSDAELALSADDRVGEIRSLSSCLCLQYGPAQIPRYARVNTIFWTTEEAIQCFISKGYSLTESAANQ